MSGYEDVILSKISLAGVAKSRTPGAESTRVVYQQIHGHCTGFRAGTRIPKTADGTLDTDAVVETCKKANRRHGYPSKAMSIPPVWDKEGHWVIIFESGAYYLKKKILGTLMKIAEALAGGDQPTIKDGFSLDRARLSFSGHAKDGKLCCVFVKPEGVPENGTHAGAKRGTLPATGTGGAAKPAGQAKQKKGTTELGGADADTP
jgi:hypothetical protein